MPDTQRGLVDAWYRGAAWLWLLRPLEWLYRALSALRRGCYRIGILPTYRAPVPVVVVGNITAGGTGKTPIVIALVEALLAAGLRPGVVSRGYGASARDFPHRVSEVSGADDCGDEPLLIYRRTGCPVVVDPNRVGAVRELLALEAVDVVLSDDGLQHYALGRDLEIAVLDDQRRLGNGFCLPAGPLREPPSRLRAVDFLLYRGGSEPATAVTYRVDHLVSLEDRRRLPLDPGQFGESVHAVAGIGQPRQFFQTLREAGFEIEAHSFPDHHRFTAADFTHMTGKPIIMTEKDAVKCAGIAPAGSWYLGISAQLPDSLCESVLGLARAKPR